MNMKSSAAGSLSAAACPATRVPRLAATGWAALCVALAGFGATSVAQAGVEFVTPANACNKVDTSSDGKDLRLPPGPNTRFDVWGSGIDVNPAVSGGFGARIVSVRNGATNAAGPCRTATGSVTVEVDPAITATADERRTLQFRMPLGDLSPLPVTVRAFRSVNHTWQPPGTALTCLLKGTGTYAADLNNDRVTISLPPGAQTDTSNCAVELKSLVGVDNPPAVDIVKPFSYSMAGLPAWMRTVTGSNSSAGISGASPRYTVDVLTLRRIATPQTLQITATAPNGQADAVTLVVNPGPPNGFVQPVACGVSGQSRVGEVFNCEARLAVTPPGAGQLVTFQAASAACFEPAASNMTYSASTGVGTVTLPATGTIHQIPLRARAGAGCNTTTSSVAHILKFWIGPRGDESGPLFSSARITIVP